MKISAIITTYNEEHNIKDAIESVIWADEVIVVDSFSTDKTKEIAEFFEKVQFLQHEYQYPAAQKNWIIPQAKNDWVILLDADERVTDTLKEEIQNTIKDAKYDAYWIYRKNHFMGKEIKYCGWQSDKVIRLFKKEKCRYNDVKVHEEMVCEGEIGSLKSKMLHYTYKDLNHYLEKWNRYTTWGANDRYKKGEKPTLYHFLVKPFARFFSAYFIRLGFLDGLIGFIICSMASMSVFMRYLKLKNLYQHKSN